MSEKAIQYLKKNHIKLSQNEIKQLFNDRETNKEIIARSQFAMVMHLAKKYELVNTSKQLDEVISDGLLGLNRAIKYYDPNKGVDFAAYAYTSIRHLMYEHRMDNEIIQPSTREKRKKLGDDEERAPKTSRIEAFVKQPDNFDFLDVYQRNDDEYNEFDYNQLCNVIKKVLKPTYAEIIIASYGLCGRNKKVSMELVGEMFNTSKQAAHQKKQTALNILKGSEVFLNYIKEITE